MTGSTSVVDRSLAGSVAFFGKLFAPARWAFPLAVYAATWLLTLVSWYLLAGEDQLAESWRSLFGFKDATNFLQIAADGYPQRLPIRPDGTTAANNSVFLPGWPGLVAAIAALTGLDLLAASLAATLLSGAAACVAVWQLADRLRGPATAHRTLLLWAFFPGAQILGMGYSEMLALTIAVLCLTALLDQRWVTAGLLAAVAVTVRPNMLALGAACLVSAVLAVRDSGRWRPLLAPLLSPLGLAGYFLWLGLRYDEPFFWFRTQLGGWKQYTDGGLTTLRRVLWLAPEITQYPEFNAVLTVGFALTVIGGWFLLRDRLPAPLWTYTLVVLALSLTATAQGAKPRFVWTAFPLFIAAASRLGGRRGTVVTVAVTVLFALGFVWLRVWSGQHPGQGAP